MNLLMIRWPNNAGQQIPMEHKQTFDLHRMFFGDLPYSFLLEIIFRTSFMYGYTILLLRFLGKRSMGQLSTLELAIIICFGSAVGDPMMGFDVPILHGMVVITTVALLQTSVEWVINKNKKLETFMEGRPDCLVNNGVIRLDRLKGNNLSQEDLFRILRGKDIEHLGEVKDAFFETSGLISVWCFTRADRRPGLSIRPREKQEDGAGYHRQHELTQKRAHYSCVTCGYTHYFEAGDSFKTCKKCRGTNWVMAQLPD